MPLWALISDSVVSFLHQDPLPQSLTPPLSVCTLPSTFPCLCIQVDFKREDLNRGDWDKIATMLTMEGMRPALSHKCPRGMRHLIRECWESDPNRRPPSTVLLAKLQAIKHEFCVS